MQMFFTLPRLPIPRQRNVGNALDAHFKANPTYTKEVTAGALALIAATPALSGDDVSMFTIDVATDGVLSAIYRVVQDYQRGFVDSVIPLGAEQKVLRDAANLLEETWFPAGIGFIRESVGLQHEAMTAIRKSMTHPDKGPAIQAAIKALGMGALVDHFVLHAALYARKLGLAGEVVTDPAEADPDPSDAWHRLYLQFAVDTMSAYKNEPATLETLLGSYQRQVEEHHTDLAKERRRAARKAKAEPEVKADAEAKAKAEADAKAKAEADAKAKAEAKPKG